MLSNGSAGREYDLAFEIPPPTSARPGVPFILPVIVAVRPLGTSQNSSIQQLGAGVSLRDETGTKAADGLTGSISSSVCSRNGNSTSGYARFDSLAIQHPGKYKLRIMLVSHTPSAIMSTAFIETPIIHVYAAAAASQRPTALQVARLRSLIPENIDISQADIEAWQQA
ncbi:hypothetical protein BJX61DRAFT_544373 [Aspergillus egyptiacus]|nr:hypothetical protein BJX61DRAFT_544373 [Aspergillus egyptiacus]